jgi:hypothetical protein
LATGDTDMRNSFRGLSLMVLGALKRTATNNAFHVDRKNE